VETVAEDVARVVDGGETSKDARPPAEVGRSAVHSANDRILRAGDRDPTSYGMGTTLTVAWVVAGAAEVFQVGDSRAYLWRGGRLEQLTKDQSLVSKLVEDGLLSPEQAETAAGRHIILQALGSEEALDVVHRSIAVKAGDVLLLCTDGLSGLVKHPALEQAFRKGGTLADQCTRLVRLAEDAGGTDNVTVVLARVDVAS